MFRNASSVTDTQAPTAFGRGSNRAYDDERPLSESLGKILATIALVGGTWVLGICFALML